MRSRPSRDLARPASKSAFEAPPRRFPRLRDRLRQRAGSAVVTGAFQGLSTLGRALPPSRPERHGVEVLRDVPYLGTGRKEHTLDVYRPADARGPLPVVLYVHGGGFRILSKDTHWLMALAFARRGYVVFNVNYRLAPTFPFPAALEDTSAAYAWVADNAHRYGGDLSRFVVAGESAGANLTLGLTLSATCERPEPWAQAVFSTGLVPSAIAPACGLFEVGNPERFRQMGISRFLYDRLAEVTAAYVDESTLALPEWRALADPLVLLEQGVAPARPLPPTFAPCGTKDPLVDDTRRLKRALDAHGVVCEAPEYEGEIHAFHAFIWRKNARQCWRDKLAFLARHVDASWAERAKTTAA